MALTHAPHRAYWVDNLDINAPEVLEPLALAYGTSLDVAHGDQGAGMHSERTPSTPLTSVSLAFQPSRLTARSGGARTACTWSSRHWAGPRHTYRWGKAEPGTVIDFYHDSLEPLLYLGKHPDRAGGGGYRRHRPLQAHPPGRALQRHRDRQRAHLHLRGGAASLRAAGSAGLGRVLGGPLPLRATLSDAIVTAGRVAILQPEATADIYRMAWVDGVDLNDDSALATALTAAGYDGEELVAATQDPAVKAQLRANTEEAVEIGPAARPPWW